MIEKMKKITYLILEKEKDPFLKKLQSLQLLHVIGETTENFDLSTKESKLRELKEIIELLKSFKSPTEIWEKKPNYPENIELLINLVLQEKNAFEAISEEEDIIKKNLAWYHEWGKFDLSELKSFSKKNIDLLFFKEPKKKFEKYENNKNLILIKKKEGFIYFCIVNYFNKNISLPFEPVVLPEKSIKEYQDLLTILNLRKKNIIKFFQEKSHFLNQLLIFEKHLENEIVLLKAKSCMLNNENIAYISGYIPQKFLAKAINMANQEKIGYIITPATNSLETPVLISNPKWLNIIQPVFKFMNILPGYDEFDVSFIFLIFFSLFFALLIGDIGYGLIFLSLTFVSQQIFKKADKKIFFLIYLLSICAIIWGVINNNFFGLKLNLPYINKFSFIQKIANNDAEFLIYFCFIIGIIQLTIAHLMRIIRYFPQMKFITELGWIFIMWGIFFLAGTLVINKPYPFFTNYLFLTGIMIVLITENLPFKIEKILFNLPTFFLKILSSFSDLVSYIRLFAVGFAGLVIAQSFNEMSLSIGFNNIFSIILASSVLFLGHSLNILLSVMAVIVHGLRLNLLEFAGHLNLAWYGKNYDPLK